MSSAIVPVGRSQPLAMFFIACCRRWRECGNRAEGDDTVQQIQHTLLGLHVAVGLLWLTANSIERILKLQSRTRWVRRVLHLNRP
jgi:hypothetical protein